MDICLHVHNYLDTTGVWYGYDFVLPSKHEYRQRCVIIWMKESDAFACDSLAPDSYGTAMALSTHESISKTSSRRYAKITYREPTQNISYQSFLYSNMLTDGILMPMELAI